MTKLTPKQKYRLSEKGKATELAYRIKNKEKIEERSKQWAVDNRERVNAYAKDYRKKTGIHLKYYSRNKEHMLAYQTKYRKIKYATDPLYRARVAARNIINSALRRKGYTKKAKSTTILGCSFPQFKKYIEEKFVDGMTWLNHGEWHIDHIKPLSTAKTEDEVLKLNHYTNLQPLWALENLQKGDNYNQ